MMRLFIMLTAAFTLMALPCFAEDFRLRDGTEFEGSVTRVSGDGHVTIRMPTGIRTHHISEFSEGTREKHFSDIKIRKPKPSRSSRMAKTRRAQGKSGAKAQKKDSMAVPALAIGGAILIAIGSLWMLIAAFVESPLWGIAFLISAGIAELAFIFIHWDRAKSPFSTQLLGVVLFAVAALIAS